MASDDTNEPGGETWQSPYRMTPETQAELLRALGLDAREIAARGAGGSALRVQRVAEGRAPADVMAVALQLKGHLGAHMGGGKYAVLCMNDAQHTNPDGTAENARGSCALMPPLEGLTYGLPVCQHAHCAHLRRDDWLGFLGAEVWQRAQTIVAEMKAPPAAPSEPTEPAPADPLEGLVERVTETKDTALAFESAVLDAAATLKDDEPHVFHRLRENLRAAGVAVSQWDRRLAEVEKRRKQEAKDAERAQAVQAADSRRAAEAEKRAKAAAKLAAEAAAADARLRLHYGHASPDDDTGIDYHMAPGRTWMERPAKRGRVEEITLANFSAPIVANVLEIEAPTATPRMTRVLSVQIGTETEQREVAVPARDFDRMEWPGALLPERAVVAAGKGNRDHLRAALGMMSRAETRRRYRFTGLVTEGGGRFYLHAGGAIGPEGTLPDIDVQPPDPADKFRLPPPPEGDELARALAAAVAFFGLEPASVVVPVVGLLFRAPIGDARVTVHIIGRKGLGKSLLAGIAQKFYGAATCSDDCTDGFPAQWTDGSSAKGVTRTLATLGNCVVVTDDLRVSGRRDESVFKMYDAVTRAIRGRSSPRLRYQDGSARNDPPPRATLLSTGEVLPQGHSTRDRVVSVQLDERPAPNLDAFLRARELLARGDKEEAHRVSSLAELVARANDGTLAAAMSTFIRWSLTHDDVPLGPRETAAAKRWGLGEGDRAATLFGSLALGLELFFQFLAEHGALSDDALKARKRRALDVMRAVAGTHSKTVEDEDPGVLLLAFVGTAVRMGKAYFAALQGNGEAGPPKSARTAWGWRAVRRGESFEWESQGVCVGRLSSNEGEVLIDPGPTLEVALERARNAGHPLAIDRESMGRALKGANLLMQTDKTRGTLHVMRRVGANMKAPFYAVKVEALGIEFDDATPASTTKTSDEDPDVPPANPDEAPDAGGFPVVEPQDAPPPDGS